MLIKWNSPISIDYLRAPVDPPHDIAFSVQMATKSSLKHILATYRLGERDIKQVCSKEHRDEFATRIVDWKAVGAALGFTQEELDMIDGEYENDDQKKTTLLFQWSIRFGKEATYLKLAKHLFAGDLLALLQQLCTIISKATLSTGKFTLLQSLPVDLYYSWSKLISYK